MNKELISLFFAMQHDTDELIEVFKKEQLLDFYINGCELRLRMEGRLENFEKFNKETGVEFSALISNKFHLAKQLHVLKIALEKLGVKGLEEDQYAMLNN
jgi:DNA repair ATPase RecN